MRKSTFLKLAASCFAVLATLVVSGIFSNQASATEHKAKLGETVEVIDGDTIVVDASDDASEDKAKAPPKPAKVSDKGAGGEPAKPAVKTAVAPVKAEVAAPKVMADDFATPKADDEVDTDSTVEIAVRGNLSPTGPTLGGNLGFAWRPANRVRLYAGFTAGKGLVDMKGEEKEMAQFGFSAAATRVMTRTVEFGAFGTVSWSYRDVVKEVSTSFAGIGPGFRLNKAGGVIFFEAALPLGWGKKFAANPWEFGTALQATLGVHF